ncbi:hypothetical protein BDW02DRAFT_571727 [Decorospora gaudefroyi]|uniref:DUF7704 domain-containing protein n=1 Tax=Decorospora gaudefroyi TaxID=184978 RepID=A0A6A5KEG0_9PLEO|nr:hypothetical protein BDW02DRAFT_571727 [Decorospora gaudefroyi]
MPHPDINPFYRIWFTWIDPLCLLCSVSTCFLNPAAALEMLTPPHILPFRPEHAALIYQCGILYGFMGIILGVLLRASPDIKVWRVVEAATLTVDVALVVAQLVELGQQGRLALGEWRGIDVFNLVFTVWVAGVRGAFLGGVGERSVVGGKKKV